MEIRNCTSLVLNIIKQDGEVLDLPPCGVVPRCSQSEECVLVIGDIALTRQTFGDVVDLPEPEKDVMLVVSRLVASACPDRSDLLVPGPLVRDSEGKVIGCRGLSII